MQEPEKIKIQNNVSNKSRKQRLDEVVQKLNEKGKFTTSILLDDRGMILSEYSSIDSIEKETIAAMFSLLHNVADRTVRNLNLESKELITIGTKQGDFYSIGFSLNNYNRQMILVSLKDHSHKEETPVQEVKIKKEKIKKEKIHVVKEFPKLKISYWRLFKVYITRKLRILPDVENISRNLFKIKNPRNLIYNNTEKTIEEIPIVNDSNSRQEENFFFIFQESAKEIQVIFGE